MKYNTLGGLILCLLFTVYAVHATNCDTVVICQNGGTCNTNNTCTCIIGYTGDLCQSDVCVPTPCENGGTCAILVSGNYTCQCPEGFSGYNCSISPTDTAAYKWLKAGFDYLSKSFNNVMIFGVQVSIPILFLVTVIAIICAIVFYRRYQAANAANLSSAAIGSMMEEMTHSGQSVVSISDLTQQMNSSPVVASPTVDATPSSTTAATKSSVPTVTSGRRVPTGSKSRPPNQRVV
jgi:hypothetical protein